MKDRALLLLAGGFIAGFSALTWRYLGEYTLLLILAFPLIDALIDHVRQRRSRDIQRNTEHKNQTPEQ